MCAAVIMARWRDGATFKHVRYAVISSGTATAEVLLERTFILYEYRYIPREAEYVEILSR